jgi:general secretion pathway protein B
MSYILDALRKADAQRERDPARGIHAQPATLQASEENSGPTSRFWLVVGALLVGAALLAVAMWWLGWLARPAVQPSVAAMVPAPAPSPTLAAVPAAANSSAPATEVLPAAPPAPPPSATPPAREAPKLPPTVTAYPPATAYPPPPAASDPARLLALAELPADVQRDLPKLAISGGVYSPTPAQRLLIVNGQVLNEGVEAAPGVLLEQIRPKTAVFNFRGYRYGVPY